MPSTYILSVIFIVVLIVVVALWMRSRRGVPRTGGVSGVAGDATRSAPALPPLSVDSASASDAFDPAATQMYMRPPTAVAGAVPQKRAGSVVSGARLVGMGGSRKGNSFPVVVEGITVGRSPSCDIVLADSRVSGQHAWIGLVDGKAVLRDLQSSNGTFVNTSRQAAVGDTELCSGDTIFFGGHQGDQFRFVAD